MRFLKSSIGIAHYENLKGLHLFIQAQSGLAKKRSVAFTLEYNYKSKTLCSEFFHDDIGSIAHINFYRIIVKEVLTAIKRLNNKMTSDPQ